MQGELKLQAINACNTREQLKLPFSVDSSIQDFHYRYDSEKPHAVTTVDPSDEFPNAIAADSCETEYNSFNQPSRIAEGDMEILLEYGSDNQRVKAVFKEDGHTLYTRYYINANYEKEVDANGVITHYNYIYGVNGLAAICVRRNGVDSMYYVHPDRLGSYTHITDSSRRVIRALHFDPWGNVKADTNWLTFDSTTLSGNLAGTFRFSRGFTGHEHYADLKIINMNGRLYDPVIARFFSPDNFVQAPGFTQSYNRYSYCLNNPLQYTDPSGENFLAEFLYGVCNFLTLPARVTTEGVSWLNDHINGNVKDDGYFHSDYLFYSAPPHYIDYQNVIYLQNPYVNGFYEPDKMTDADGTTYRTEYYWTAVGAGGTYNLTFANQTFSGTFGPYREYIQWHTREVPVENETPRLQLQPLFMFSSRVNISLNCFSVGNGAKTNLIESAARYNFSDNQMWHQFIGLGKAERALRYEKALGGTVGKYLNVSKYAGVTLSAVSALTETYNYFSYSAYNGFQWDVSAKYSLDMAMLLVGTFCGPVGFVISTTYFIIDVSTDGFGGFGKMY